MEERVVPAGQFKARCLALLDEVAQSGQEIVVTKRGKPVARLVPMSDRMPASLRGSIVREDDLISPIDGDWDADR